MTSGGSVDLRRFEPVRLELAGVDAVDLPLLVRLLELWLNSPFFGRTPASNMNSIQVTRRSVPVRSSRSSVLQPHVTRFSAHIVSSTAESELFKSTEPVTHQGLSDLSWVDTFLLSQFDENYESTQIYSLVEKHDDKPHILVCTSGYFHGSLSSLIYLTLHLRELKIIGRTSDMSPPTDIGRQLTIAESLQVLLPTTAGCALRCGLARHPEHHVLVPPHLWGMIQAMLPELDHLEPGTSSVSLPNQTADETSIPGVRIGGYFPYRVSKIVQTALGTFFRFAESRLPLRATQFLGKLLQLTLGRSRHSRNAPFHMLPPLSQDEWSELHSHLVLRKLKDFPHES